MCRTTRRGTTPDGRLILVLVYFGFDLTLPESFVGEEGQEAGMVGHRRKQFTAQKIFL